MTKILQPKTNIELFTPASSGSVKKVRPSLFCPWMNFVPTISNAKEIKSNYNAQQLSVKFGTDLFNAAILFSEELINFSGDTGTVSFENKIINLENVSAYDLTLAIIQKLDEENAEVLCGVYITSASGGQVRDAITGAPLSVLTLENDYRNGFKLDIENETAIAYDNKNLSASVPLTVYSPFTKTNEFFIGIVLTGNQSSNFLFSPNTGSRPFYFPFSSGRYCSLPLPPPLPPIIFCNAPTLQELVVSENPQTININGINIEAISQGFTGAQSVILPDAPDAQFINDDGEIKFESQIINWSQNNSAGIAFGIFFVDFTSPEPVLAAGVVINPSTVSGFIFDVASGVPISNSLPIDTGYKNAIYLNTRDLIARYKDNNNVDVTIGVTPYNNLNTIIEAVLLDGGEILSEGIEIKMNYGSENFALGEDASRWCNIIPLPPIVYCSPVNLIVNEGTPPNNQTIILSGENNLTITATSLGNNATESGVAASEFFNTQTESVKIETTITAVPSTFNLSAPATGIGFFHDIFGTPVLITAVIYIPVSGGFFIDGQGNFLSTGTLSGFVNPLQMSISLDSIPQNKQYGFQVDTGISGDITVHGVTSPVSAFDQQEDIAAVIVSNGFTDPTIQSLTISPSDNRTVIITYTLAAEDAFVDVSTTNGILFYEDTNASEPYQLGKSETRFALEVFGFPEDFDFKLPVSEFYDSSLNVYMATIINTGDFAGQQFIQTVNFGSSQFLLGNYANRWCEV